MPTDAWFKANPKISGYVPQTVYDCLMKFKDERGISISQAITVVLAEYFGVNYQVDQPSLGGVTLAQIHSLEQTLSSFIESVDQRFQELEAIVKPIKLPSNLPVDQGKLLIQSTSSKNGEAPSETTDSLKNETDVLVPEIIQALEQDKQDEVILLNKLLNELPDEPLTGDISDSGQVGWQSANSVLLGELHSGLPDRKSDEELSDELKVDENEPIPGIQPLSAGELSRRLKADRSVITRYKNGSRKQTLAEWSKSVDPDGVPWEYSEEQKKYIPFNQGKLHSSLQSELIKMDDNSNLS